MSKFPLSRAKFRGLKIILPGSEKYYPTLYTTSSSNGENLNALEKRFINRIEELEKQYKEVQINMEKAMKEKEKEIDNLRNDQNVKDTKINALELRVDQVEKAHITHKKYQEKRIKDLENSCKQKVRKEKDLAEVCAISTIKCNKCDYQTTSRQGLKIHSSKVHSNINFEEFPAACDICEKVLQNESDLKKHKKSQHTYHNVRYQCNECDFMAHEVETLNVHFGSKHTEKKQCGLCDENFESSEDLANHLSKCEILMCANSGCRDYFLTMKDLKDHINENHRKNAPAHYTFSYWIVDSKDKCEKEIKKYFHTIYPKDW